MRSDGNLFDPKPFFRCLGTALGLMCWMGQSLDAATFVVTNTADSGNGTLRAAILAANATSGADIIQFNFTGVAPYTIAPLTELPTIAEALTIDGTSQPGYSNRPLVRLSGASTTPPGSVHGLFLQGGNTTVRGLAIDGFTNGIWIEIRGSNVVQGCHIGTDTTGIAGPGNGRYGIAIQNTAYNRIGGTNAGEGNLIANNRNTGILIFGSSASSNVVAGNRIGTTLDGSRALGTQTNGVFLYSAPRNTVGGTEASARNLISGHQQVGVYIFGSSATANRVLGNYIGTGENGATAVGNALDGVLIQESPGNTVGGSAAGAGNVISGNQQRGVVIYGTSATGNQVLGNLIGTDQSGLLALGNQFSGVGIFGGRNNVIGGQLPGTRNVIAGNLQSGILITPGTAANNRIEGNLIGVDVTGTNALANSLHGVSIDDAANNTVGGMTPGVRNVIAGNGAHGVNIVGATATGNTVAGNHIGTDLPGLQAVRNALCGVFVESGANVIGGASAPARNVISGNGEVGILLLGTLASANLVQGNFIGTDAAGSRALGNGLAGVGISDAPDNLVGGANFGGGTPGAGNLISGNRDAGVFLWGSAATRNRVFGNYIGTDATGNARLGNLFEGIYLEEAVNNLIGGDYGNLISGNGTRGVYLTNATGNTIAGNLVGTRSDGVSDLGHPFHAIELEAGSHDNTIGGENGNANRIAFSQNGYAGVRIRDGSAGNRILGNLIFGNTGLGIDLGPAGVTANDPCDADGGANQRQNFPVLTLAASSAGLTQIRGTLPAAAQGNYRLQFFANATPDASGCGEGETYLGSATVTTGEGCSADISVALPVATPPGFQICATATDQNNNTSEFSAGVVVTLTPVMQAASQKPDMMTMAWPESPYNYVLEEATDLTPPVHWTAVTGAPPAVVNGTVAVTVGTTNGIRFYRLRYP